MISDVFLFFGSDFFEDDDFSDDLDVWSEHYDPCAGCEPNWDCSTCPVMNPDVLGVEYD